MSVATAGAKAMPQVQADGKKRMPHGGPWGGGRAKGEGGSASITTKCSIKRWQRDPIGDFPKFLRQDSQWFVLPFWLFLGRVDKIQRQTAFL